MNHGPPKKSARFRVCFWAGATGRLVAVLVALSLACGLLVPSGGCRRREEVGHPTLDANAIQVGDTKGEVLAAFGEPGVVVKGEGDGTEAWHYFALFVQARDDPALVGYVVNFRDGRVVMLSPIRAAM